jgi:transcriptional regulator of acetoin/glycerol metabolism
VLEDRKVLRIGGHTPRPLDVRFVAATNRDLGGWCFLTLSRCGDRSRLI